MCSSSYVLITLQLTPGEDAGVAHKAFFPKMGYLYRRNASKVSKCLDGLDCDLSDLSVSNVYEVIFFPDGFGGGKW